MGFFDSLQHFYDDWSVQIFVLFSLLLQVILIMFAPIRKRTCKGILIFMIWIAYLLADWAATFTIGLISRRREAKNQDDRDHGQILAFWAPFLLLHLGGPDTVTAFSLEDNALWRRHFLDLITQMVTASIIFVQFFDTNKLWISTILLFAAGIIKYSERTYALYCANLSKFRESMLEAPDSGPNYAKLMEEYDSKQKARLPTQIELIAEPNKGWRAERYAMDEDKLDDQAVVRHAYHFFETFKGLIVDLIFSFRERDESRAFFRRRDPQDALKVLAVELNFMYEVLYTKVVVVYSVVGFIFRFMSLSVVVAGLILFTKIDKHGLKRKRRGDIEISYTLLYGAIVLEAIALWKLVFSDRTVAYLQKFSKSSDIKASVSRYCLLVLKYYFILKNKITRQRWSEHLGSFNLINYCLQELPRAKHGCIARLVRPLIWVTGPKHFEWGMGLKHFYDGVAYVTRTKFEETLWEFIFTQLKTKSSLASDPDTAKRMCSARGDWVLLDQNWKEEHGKLMSYILDVDYDQSVMIWHIATDLCWERDIHTLENDSHLKISKILSDYMLYLLIMQPTMMSAVVGIGEIRFRDTCAEAKEFFSRKVPKKRLKEEEEMARKAIFETNTDVKPIDLKGDRSKSVLFDGCILAKELESLKEKKWDLISKVWVELLSYAASHCRANTHAAQLSKGGELLTFVWLLMVQLGIGDQFQINDGHARAKLIVGK